MTSSFIPYGRQLISDDDIEAVVRTLRSPTLTQGPAIEQFEKGLGAYIKAPHAVAVSNGTAALHIACLAAGLGPGDAAIVPAITFAATSNAVLYVGAKVVFADIDPKTNGLSAATLAAAYETATQRGLKPKVVLPVHYAGLPCEMEGIWAFARKHQMLVIEDACHALGAQYRASTTEDFVPVGGDRRADMVVWSFHPVKHLTTAEGGAVTTHDARLAKQLRLLRSHGITKEAAAFEQPELAFDEASKEPNPWYQEMQHLGFNYRITDPQAALGTSQLTRQREYLDRRRDVAGRYFEALASLPGLTLPPGDYALGKHSYHLFPVRIDFGKLGRSRRDVMMRLQERGIGTQVHYLPVHWHPYYRRNQDRWVTGGTPTAASLYAEELSIPMFPMTEAELERVVEAVGDVLKRK